METYKSVLDGVAKKCNYENWDSVYSKGDNSDIIHILEIAVNDLAISNNELFQLIIELDRKLSKSSSTYAINGDNGFYDKVQSILK